MQAETDAIVPLRLPRGPDPHLHDSAGLGMCNGAVKNGRATATPPKIVKHVDASHILCNHCGI